MNSRVPAGKPERVRPPSWSRARPKSETRARMPSEVSSTSTLPGLMSRCSRPWRWAAWSPSATWRSSSTLAARGSSGCSAERLRPSTSCSTMQGRPSRVPTPWTFTTWGWSTRACRRASSSRRSASPGSAPRRNFTATERSRPWSQARWTWPMPPSPRKPLRITRLSSAARGRVMAGPPGPPPGDGPLPPARPRRGSRSPGAAPAPHLL